MTGDKNMPPSDYDEVKLEFISEQIDVLGDDPVFSRMFKYGHLTDGDCNQIEGTLIIRSDGTATFTCVTWTNSTHSGDYWWTAFRLTDSAGVITHNEPFHSGPRMDDGNPPPRYRWGFNFNYDGSKYLQTTVAYQGYRC